MARDKTTYQQANHALQGSPLRWLRVHPGAPLSIIPKPGSRLENDLYKELTPEQAREGKRPILQFWGFGKVIKAVKLLKEEFPEDFHD